MNQPFYPGDRTYHVSDERLRAFRQLMPEQRLQCVEELAASLRMKMVAREAKQKSHLTLCELVNLSSISIQ